MYARLREPIERYVRYLFNLNTQDAEDIASTAFESAFKAMYPGRSVSQPTDWMYQIAKRKAIDFVRHRRVIPMRSLSAPSPENGLSLADTLLAPDDDEAYADTLDRRRLLGYIFGSLPPKYAAIIKLYDHEGYTHKDITRIMGITYSNSKTMLDRARSRARQLAAEYLSGQIVTKRRVRLTVD
jgi:RNA polymerase sigma-70 factor (ECF subfamily)